MGKYKYKTEPWLHQKKALSYLYKRDSAALYTDMGTGKTKVMIDLIQSRDFKHVLVVVPKKAGVVWEEEIHIHGICGQISILRLENLSVEKVISQLNKTQKCTKYASRKACYIIIINYDKVWRKGIDNIFLRKTFGLDCVICDESHRIKSPRSKCSMYLARLGKKVPHRYLMTGTPMAENPSDVFAQYKFLDTSIFGENLGKFREEYENLDPIMTARIGHRILDKKQPYKNLDKLYEKMFSCAFYIKSSVELPEQIDMIKNVYMPDRTEKLYKQFLNDRVAILNDKYLESSNALTLVLRLQQITSGYAQVEDLDSKETKVVNIDHARVDALIDLLEQFPEGEPVVVFARFKKDLKNIRRACDKIGLSHSELSGSVDTLQAWKQGDTQILAVQYSSGSESINLTRAHYCIYYSLTQRLALYEQSRKRVHRPGQQNCVFYYHLIEKRSKGDTIDEKIYQSLQQKKNIVDYIMEKGWE